MKKIAIVVAIGTVALTPAYASDRAQLEFCEGFSRMAYSIMERRQVPGSLAPDMIAEAQKKFQGSMQQIAVNYIRDAFKVPRYSSKNGRNAAVSDFANEAYTECLNMFDPGSVWSGRK